MKISELTQINNPTGDMVVPVAYNGQNGKVKLSQLGLDSAKVNSLESDVTTLQKVRTYPIGGFVDTPDDMLYPYGDATVNGSPNLRLKWVGFHNEWYYWFLKNNYVGNGTDENPQYRKGLYEVLVDSQTENYAIGERISLPYATIGIHCTGAVYKISNQGFIRLNGLTWRYNSTTRKLTLTDDEGAGSIEVTLPLSTETEAGLMSAADKQTLAMNTNAIQELQEDIDSRLDGIDQYIDEVANPNFRYIMQGLIDLVELIMQGMIDLGQATEHINAESAEDLFSLAYNLASDAPGVANATSIEGAIRTWLDSNEGSNTETVLRNRLTHGGIKFLNADTGAWECYIFEGTKAQWNESLANRGTTSIFTAIVSMLTRIPQALNIRQLYGKLLSHIFDWQRAEENFNGLSELIENMLERIDALEALTANTVEMEVTYDDDTTETFHLVNVPSAVAPTTQEEEEE